MRAPCAACPWRIANHGKKNPWKFYTKANLRRLWNQLRGATRAECRPQSCHPTDPGHPDHVAAGAKEGATPQECPGSVILIYREFEKIAKLGNGVIGPQSIDAYLKAHKDGLTKHGMLYWIVQRYQFGGVPFVGGPKLPEVDLTTEGIGRL